MSIPLYYMFKVTHVQKKHTNELVYIGVISSLEASMPLIALRANYNSVEYCASVDSDALLYKKALEKVAGELKEYFDNNGCYPRDNQKKFEATFKPQINQLFGGVVLFIQIKIFPPCRKKYWQ